MSKKENTFTEKILNMMIQIFAEPITEQLTELEEFLEKTK